jgi:farnesyl-diphosphate farnesyltransferase
MNATTYFGHFNPKISRPLAFFARHLPFYRTPFCQNEPKSARFNRLSAIDYWLFCPKNLRSSVKSADYPVNPVNPVSLSVTRSYAKLREVTFNRVLSGPIRYMRFPRFNTKTIRGTRFNLQSSTDIHAQSLFHFPMPTELNNSLLGLLKANSRSFYLTLRVLPGAIRPQIALAYLLARTTDTIADTEIVPPVHRLESLQKLRDRISGVNATPLDFKGLAQQQASPAERSLLEKVEESLTALGKFSRADQELIRAVLDTITSGQELDLQRFADASSQKIISLQTEADLDDYTYRVAGCVGGFWTKICRAHLFPDAAIDETQLIANGIRFGKGLQLVNILRDMAGDLRKGRCYLPAEKLSEINLVPADLLDPANENRLRPLYDRWLDVAESHLAAGWVYTNSLPAGQFRVRLACAWPILIGVRTLARLRAGRILDPAKSIKVPRNEVKWMMLRSLVSYPFPGAWQKQFDFHGKAVASGPNLA